MLDQLDDGSHEITLSNICCPGCEPFPTTSGVLRWHPEEGISYSLTFDGIDSIIGTSHYARPKQHPGVGRFLSTDFTRPDWTAETDDGTEILLFGVDETHASLQTSGTSGSGVSCNFEGKAVFAVVDIPCTRMLAFENSTEEPYRLFFVGGAGRRFHKEEYVSFTDVDGTHTSVRCSIILSRSPDVALVSAHSLVKCQPSGWLAFAEPPTKADCEVPAYSEQNFVSFLNGEKVAFHWSDRKVGRDKVRRTYFGWVKSKKSGRSYGDHQPLPFMGGVEVSTHGDAVLSHLPSLFQRFIARSQLFDFGLVPCHA